MAHLLHPNIKPNYPTTNYTKVRLSLLARECSYRPDCRAAPRTYRGTRSAVGREEAPSGVVVVARGLGPGWGRWGGHQSRSPVGC